jgi:hypothetical protein
LAELLKWYQMRESVTPPPYLGSARYWILTVLMALAGGLLAVMQNATSPLLALNIGISAPLILKALAAVTPVQPPKAAVSTGAARPRLLDMIAGR